DHLQICERSLTCCTQEMEHRLSAQSREEFDRVLHDEIGKVRAKFATRMQRFDGEWTSCLVSSARPLFARLCTCNGGRRMVHALSASIEQQHTIAVVDLPPPDFYFFAYLYYVHTMPLVNQHVFETQQLQFPNKNGPCDNIPDVSIAFIPNQTASLVLEGIRRSALQWVTDGSTTVGKQSVNKVYALAPKVPSAAQMTFCCSSSDLVVSIHFDNFPIFELSDALLNLANRLESSFNIESVVNPIGVKISEAIMDFQENHVAILQTLYDKCGKLRLARRASGGHQELQFETLKFGGAQQGAMRPTTAAGTSMDRLVQGIRKQIRTTRGMWSQLPDRLCRPPTPQGSPPLEDCWDGLHRARSENNHTGSGPTRTKGHRNKDGAERSSSNVVINQLILTLKIITNKLTLAYSGHDVQWQDSADIDDMGSGSGSGSGDDDFGPGRSTTASDIFFSVSVPTFPPSPNKPRMQVPETSPSSSSCPRAASLIILIAALLLKMAHSSV
ncbi:unnamed protein product, partial [Ixodes hexagonus]